MATVTERRETGRGRQDDIERAQQALFERISQSYDAVHGRVVGAIHRVAQDRYYSRCLGKRVLDIGNAGQSAEEVLGPVGASVSYFVGLDRSLPMLRRKRVDSAKVVGDGLALPFRDGAFDYVIVNGVLHHLGTTARECPGQRVGRFVEEAFRVASEGLIVYELFTAPLLERLERVFVRLAGAMPTFVFSEPTIDACVREQGLVRSEVASLSLSELVGPFYWYSIIMDVDWLKLPAFLSPFRHGFFVVGKTRSGR